MTRATRIKLVKKALRLALKVERDPAIKRFALFQIASDVLDGRIRELVWTEPPFPELGDKKP